MSRGAINEQSSVRKGASYNEVYQTGQEPKEGHSWSSERETSARSPDKDEENYMGEEDKEEIDEGEVDGEGEIEDDGVMEGDEDENGVEDRTLEVGTLVRSFFLKCGPSMTSYQRWRPTFLRT